MLGADGVFKRVAGAERVQRRASDEKACADLWTHGNKFKLD
jgi:hypothetical protein